MGEGLKRVAKQCGGLTVTSGGQTAQYDGNGRRLDGPKERPIIMRDWEVRALANGRKTQFRRPATVINGCFSQVFPYYPLDEFRMEGSVAVFEWQSSVDGTSKSRFKCPFGSVGDHLWPRETWALVRGWEDPDTRSVDTWEEWTGPIPNEHPGGDWAVVRRGDGWWDSHFDDRGFNWRPSIFLPRWASRCTIETVSVRVERLHDISEADCWAEGIEEADGQFANRELIDMANRIGCCIEDAKPMFACLWESEFGKKPGMSWDDNPFVWRVEHKTCENGGQP